ncbi:MAG: FAD-binding protein [Pseudonocardiaceae bacterium]
MSDAAFDPVTRTWVPREHPGAVPVPALRGVLVRDEDSVRWAADDFGHVVQHRPWAVLRPGGAADVAAIVAFAGEVGLSVAARGAGHSTYGQAQNAGGIVIDMTCLDEVAVSAGRVRAQAGALWSTVLDATLPQGGTPGVLTDYLPTTVGGTLTVGGVGGASHRHGLQVDGVVELDVVTGRGRQVSCSPERNQRLFDAVRAGLGQCGIITSATLGLIPAPTRVRCYRLYYQDLAAYLADQRRLVAADRFDYLEGQILSAGPGSWCYLLEAAAYYTPPMTPPAAPLKRLDHERDEVEDTSYRQFARRMEPGEAVLRASGEWLHPHVWLNVFLPEDATASVVGAVLAELTATDLGNSGLGLLYPLRTDRLHAPLTRIPDTDLVWLFALLRTAGADDPTASATLVEANRAILDRAVASGATAYPINTLPMSPADWETHFGPRWPQLLAAKAEFDPHGILAPGHGISAIPSRAHPAW